MRGTAVTWRRFSFGLKGLTTLALVVAADRLWTNSGVGSVLGAFASSWVLVTVVLQPSLRRDRRAVIATIAAGLLAGGLLDRPTLIGWCLFWVAISVAALSARTGRDNDTWEWGLRLLRHAYTSWIKVVADLVRVWRLSPRPILAPWGVLVAGCVLPVGGGLIFLGLFAAANPIIGAALSNIPLPSIGWDLLPRALFWAIVLVMVWATLRPGRAYRAGFAFPQVLRTVDAQPVDLPGLSLWPVTVALLLFNGLFAIENGLDVAFLWSGAGPPAGVTLAQYAHRGAYPLIFTALIAAGFCLVFLRRGSASARDRRVRRLVGVWVAQNVVLCLSSALRTVDYVEAFSLTRLRIAALLWMGLVTFGLALIGWRMWKDKTAAWLVNANVAAVGVVLAFVSVVDLGAVAASWNVAHAPFEGRPGPLLDLCYLQRLGSAALDPLAQLERRPLVVEDRARVVFVRRVLSSVLERSQADWRHWTWRGARRLEAARAASSRETPSTPVATECDGPIVKPPAPAPPAHVSPTSASLTPRARP